ncbi:SFK1-like membrane protein [Calycina marina]|uniref:SFK1-like membrane protein n=1 Tax=Calycina marina TaxID=1763456 RepID=A0A9P8CCN7_9HELO|nr:SFK1-like membrane protein [Calycina marina]
MWGVSYWVFPVISALCWIGMLMGMLIHWCVDGKPHYSSMEPTQNIAYISDVGAGSLKPLFITGSCVTTVFLDLSFISERWLRHNGRLVANTSVFQKVLSLVSLFFAGVGTVGLICLSIFDTLRYPTLHDLFLLLFIVGYVISAVFLCWEYQRLGIHFRQHAVLRNSFWIKLAFIFIELALAIAFAVCNFKYNYNAAAVLEWAVSFVFTFYVLSFVYDLIPAVKTKGAPFNRSTEMEQEANDPEARAHDREGRFTADSERTLAANDIRTTSGTKAPVGRNF